MVFLVYFCLWIFLAPQILSYTVNYFSRSDTNNLLNLKYVNLNQIDWSIRHKRQIPKNSTLTTTPISLVKVLAAFTTTTTTTSSTTTKITTTTTTTTTSIKTTTTVNGQVRKAAAVNMEALESLKKSNKNLELVPNPSEVLRFHELMKKDKIGKPLSKSDQFLAGRSGLVSTSPLNKSRMYNPGLNFKMTVQKSSTILQDPYFCSNFTMYIKSTRLFA